MVSAALDTHALPDPDLIIRTSGEYRVSNFLLWQAVYAEFDFPAMPWPDFGAAQFGQAVEGFRSRRRRFGGLQDPLPAPTPAFDPLRTGTER